MILCGSPESIESALSQVFTVFSSSLGEGASVGSHFVWIDINGRGTINFSASLRHSAWVSFGILIWKVCWSEPNPNVIVMTRIKALVTETSPVLLLHHLVAQVSVNLMIAV